MARKPRIVDPNDPIQLKEIHKKVLLCYAKCNMNISETARKLNYHRNSIDYNLECIQDCYGLDPRRFYDLVKLLVKIQEDEDLNELEPLLKLADDRDLYLRFRFCPLCGSAAKNGGKEVDTK